MSNKQISESISKHQFKDAYPYFSDEITWNMIGGEDVKGKKEVLKTCEESATYLSTVETTFTKFETIVADNTVIIESEAEYIDTENKKSIVSSCDIYHFKEEKLNTITSYNVEITQTK